ncbi:hypothetical protein O1L55_10405 [Streptomyces albulus]|nr:hypothetical protein [Streptomyces noursei]
MVLRSPGVSWALWDAGDTLRDPAVRDFAGAAFDTLAAGYDEDFHLFGDHLGDRLGLCHGAAGCWPSPTRCTGTLDCRRPPHCAPASWRASTPTGPAPARWGGTDGPAGRRRRHLSAVLTATGGARDWLPCLGLR